MKREPIHSLASRLHEIELLTDLPLENLTKEELTLLVQALSRELLSYIDLTCDVETAGRILGRKRSWIYDAVSRPSTDFHRRVAGIVARIGTSLVFRFSDLVRIRRELFETDSTSVTESDLRQWLRSLSNGDDQACQGERRTL